MKCYLKVYELCSPALSLQDDEWEDVDDENENVSPKDTTLQNIIEAMFASSADYPGFIS